MPPIENDDIVTWKEAADAWEQATGLSDTEDGGLATALLLEVVAAGAKSRRPEGGAIYRLDRVIEDITNWRVKLTDKLSH